MSQSGTAPTDLRALAEKATQAPWIVAEHFAKRNGARTYVPIVCPGNDPVPIAVVHRDVDGRGRDEGEANARLVVALRNEFVALLDKCDALEAERDAMREAVAEAGRQIEYLHEKFGATGSGNAVLARISAALAPKEPGE